MLATIIQVLGAVSISTGAWLLFPPAGLIVAGIFAILFGLSLEIKNRGINAE